MDDFINSKAMMTPAIAGTAVTTITGILVSQFGLPGNWSVLALSMLFGLLTWADETVSILHRVVFYLINSATILVFAIGLNESAITIKQYQIEEPQSRQVIRSDEFFQPWF